MLDAPFPYYGSKRRWAETIWERLGNPDVYVEPFAGSIACLLLRPDGGQGREVVCDTDSHIANVWRSLAHNPDAVANWCDYPTIHQDLTARHRWLVEWASANAHKLSRDPLFFDPHAAGWWLWGIANWIGSGWCYKGATTDSMPAMGNFDGGMGVAAQRIQVPLHEKRPFVNSSAGGRGVSAQRTRRQELGEWVDALRDRLRRVVVLNRDWTSAVSRTVMMDTPTSSPTAVKAVLMDPPYVTDDRHSKLYGSDVEGSSTEAARLAWEWSVAHGDDYRIAYCCHEGDVDLPDRWTFETSGFKGVKRPDRRSRRDMVAFSPACLDTKQGSLAL